MTGATRAQPHHHEARRARLVVRRSPGSDPARTCFLIVNHVNLFDPFVLYATVPRFFAGWSSNLISTSLCMADESASAMFPCRMRIGLRIQKRMWRNDACSPIFGVSLAPEGPANTRRPRRPVQGRRAAICMAVQFGTPIVPVSLVGSYDQQKRSWFIRSGNNHRVSARRDRDEGSA